MIGFNFTQNGRQAMRYKVQVRDVDLYFDEWEDASEVIEMFVSQGHIVSVYGVTEDD